jgi:hypothetical protein
MTTIVFTLVVWGLLAGIAAVIVGSLAFIWGVEL